MFSRFHFPLAFLLSLNKPDAQVSEVSAAAAHAPIVHRRENEQDVACSVIVEFQRLNPLILGFVFPADKRCELGIAMRGHLGVLAVQLVISQNDFYRVALVIQRALIQGDKEVVIAFLDRNRSQILARCPFRTID